MALLAVVRHAQLEQSVGKTHHAQTDLAVVLAHPLDFRQGVVVGVDHIVQKTGGLSHSLAQPLPIHKAFFIFRFTDKQPKVQAAQVARLVRQQGLFSAGVGSLDSTKLRRRVVGVDTVDVHHTRLAGLPSVVDDDVPYVALRVDAPSQLSRQRANQSWRPVVGFTTCGRNRFHAVDRNQVLKRIAFDIKLTRQHVRLSGTRVAHYVR